MTRRIWAALIVGAVALALAVPVLADHGTLTEQGNCPEVGKVEATTETQDAINGLVLDAGVHVCIKGGQATVLVTADGQSTLAELLGTGQDVSHYSIVEQSTTTTTVQETTTTSEATTTTTDPGTTTTTRPEETTTTTEQESTTTTVAETTTTPPTAPPGLPFTGIDVGLLVVAAVGMIALGGTLAWTFRDRLS